MAHTPGPWVTSDTKFANGIRTEVEAAGECGPICSCIRTVNARKVRSWNEVDANAKLIAAAPELLDALKVFAREFGKEVDNDIEMNGSDTVERVCFVWPIIKRAINKAEGRNA